MNQRLVQVLVVGAMHLLEVLFGGVRDEEISELLLGVELQLVKVH